MGSTYSLQNLVTGKLEDVHVTQLAPFEHDPIHTDPRLVANRDKQSWDVQEILAHRGNPNKRSDMEFKIRWAGFSVEKATWEPWSSVRLTKALQEYLPLHGLRRLVNSRLLLK
jgi:hypothetical protein